MITNKIKSNKYIISIYKRFQNYKWYILYKINKKLPASLLYKKVFHKKIDWNNPVDLIEKIAWLELYSDTSLWTECADKYKVREYITEKGLGSYLPRLYGVWNYAEDINFNDLPNSFILKTNNGCGTVIPIQDKNNINFNHVKHTLNKWIKTPYGYSGGQYHYLKIKPVIIAEELLENDELSKEISPTSLIDYKIWCINGTPIGILVTYNRQKGSLNLNFYDTEWNECNEILVETKHYKIGKGNIPCPRNLKDMLSICKTLSQPFKQVRIDFYNLNGRIYIGELTFSTGYGYFTQAFYKTLGEKIRVSGN